MAKKLDERKEDFYFNFTEAELAKMELSVTGGLTTIIQRAIEPETFFRICIIFSSGARAALYPAICFSSSLQTF